MKKILLSLAAAGAAVLVGAAAVSAAGPAADAVAKTLGLDRQEIRALRHDGLSLAQIAERRGVEPQALVDALVARWTERIEARVENGALTPDQATQLRRRFFQDAAHELRTPLTVIDATTSAILDGVYAPEDRHLETIRDQARLLSRIVDDLRTISLAESGALPLAREPIRVGDLLADIRAAFAARAESADVILESEVARDAVVAADRDRLIQALGALMDNALRFTPAGGTIRLLAKAAPSQADRPRVRLAIQDTGPGISPADLPHLFERFYQADPGRDRATRTSGLGLAIVKALVEAHGGTVGAENAPGGGARFWIELPELEAHPATSRTAPASSDPSANPSV